MCEDLEKEIEEAMKLGRTDRKKKERELRKKYNDKSIEIRKGRNFIKGESLNREQRRALKKDKNLFEEILKIIRKYFPELNKIISELTDRRNKNYITYNIKTIIYTRLFALMCGITTMTGISNTENFDTKKTIDNLSKICNQNLKEIPDWQTIQDVIEQLDIEEIRNIRRYMVKALIIAKCFINIDIIIIINL